MGRPAGSGRAGRRGRIGGTPVKYGDPSSRGSVHALVETATGLGDVTGVIHAAGVSPSQASPVTILAVDLYGTALVLEEAGNVIARGGAGVVIASQSGHRLGALTADQNAALATTPADELLKLPMLQPDQVTDSLQAYQLAKRGNSMRVMAEAVRWGKRGARINTISPGIIFTPLARDELTGPRGKGYRRMIELSPAGRGGTPRRGRNSWRASHGLRRRVHHWQRLPDGRRRDGVVLLRRTRLAVTGWGSRVPSAPESPPPRMLVTGVKPSAAITVNGENRRTLSERGVNRCGWRALFPMRRLPRCS